MRLAVYKEIAVRIRRGPWLIMFLLSYPGDGAWLLTKNEAGSSPAEGANCSIAQLVEQVTVDVIGH